MRTITKHSPTSALVWQEAEGLKNLPEARNIPCYEARVKGGKYRAAVVVYADTDFFPAKRSIGYEAFFIPDGAKSAADVRDIAERLASIDEAKTIAEQDYRKRQTSR